MDISYPSFIVGSKPIHIPSVKASSLPIIDIHEKKPGMYYTIIMFDPDAPYGFDDKDRLSANRTYLHWLITNISFDQQGKQKTLSTAMDYTPPSPPFGTHRYRFILFQQPKRIKMNPITKRESFDVAAFTQQHHLHPIASSVFLSSHS